MRAIYNLLLASLVLLAPHAPYPAALTLALISCVLAIFLWVFRMVGKNDRH